ncbi:uncharacterized protein LOC142356687, partial [Convolutriloba macropyga]|uniref:uncharacterized protein LOC142356687 n=1 Tax=Convolutriloba macropyga TaxID=536237 RepID=UPI003F5227D2
ISVTGADNYCKQNVNGSRLFGSLDGTEEQLHMLLTLMERKTFWLGFERVGNTFKTFDEKSVPVSNILWDVGQPEGETYSAVYCYTDCSNRFPNVIHDVARYEKYDRFVCDRMAALK